MNRFTILILGLFLYQPLFADVDYTGLTVEQLREVDTAELDRKERKAYKKVLKAAERAEKKRIKSAERAEKKRIKAVERRTNLVRYVTENTRTSQTKFESNPTTSGPYIALNGRTQPTDPTYYLSSKRLAGLIRESRGNLQLYINCLLYTSPSPRDRG